MSFLGTRCTFTRFRIADPVPTDLWPAIPDKLKQFCFKDIDAIPEERSWGWTSFDDMLDTDWRSAPPHKGAYLTFAFRLDTRRIPSGVLKKHVLIALREEENRIRAQGKKFVARARKNELRDQVRLRLMQHFLPIPAVFEVIWATDSGRIYLASNNAKLIDLFVQHFTLSFDVHLEALTPYGLAASILDEAAICRADDLEPTKFV